GRNFTIVFVWIGWWALLILVTVPLLGRGWCSICPIPVLGEWVQRGAILGPQPGRGWGLDRRWPRGLRNIWLQNAGFVMLALFAVVILTQPLVTSLVLLALFVLAFGASLFFERRAFCRYLCPVGGFIGLYSQMAPVALRVKDTAICVSHREKTCYTGNAEGYGCPWGVFPAGLVKNINCGLCFECVRACPYDNIAFYLRPLGADLAQARGRKLDEAYKAFIMLGSALLYSAVMLGPWGWLKSAAFAVGSRDWFLYALAFSLFVLLVVPGAFLAAVLAGRALAGLRVSLRKGFTHLAYALVPLGLAAWIAFSLSFVFANLSYVWPALSDPMGWGWNLIGTAGVLWTPYLSGLVPYVQVGVMVAGLAWSAGTAHGIVRQLGANEATSGREAVGALPVVAFNLAATILLLWLLVG
nr:4Fe-4S binding protein [Gammaproteobacteria bacterium]NIT64277.1 4Fe-4S binding protein [Gammaproteobacteria bacterium]NIW03442.1 4Fe-4S binding protein [Gammaproteobacteria bacterium]NIY32857.1 4Fe-4S binding protein [Gammaproteobacteria bacterium]NIY42053.1 4Fe-4S binding protein [Gemmatimonadota bacterium]